MTQSFKNRAAAGTALAEELTAFKNRKDVLVLALPRGGVPVGYEIAKKLHVPLDIFLVRKLGAPGQRELAMGAIASGGVRVLNQEVIDSLMVTDKQIEEITREEQLELERRQEVYRGDRPLPQIQGQTIILVDDGIATGATIRAGITALRQQKPASIVVAVPVAPPETITRLNKEADKVVCLLTPEYFMAISQWYAEFPQCSDEEVQKLIRLSTAEYN
jgi:putative phosphoribosyl transferase